MYFQLLFTLNLDQSFWTQLNSCAWIANLKVTYHLLILYLWHSTYCKLNRDGLIISYISDLKTPRDYNKSAFTLGVRDSSVESPNTMLVI